MTLWKNASAFMMFWCAVGIAWAETPLRDRTPDTGNEALRLHLLDPSRIVQTGTWDLGAVTGKAQTEDYDCGLELWARPAGQSGPWRMSECLLREKPDWVLDRLPRKDGAFWAPDFIDATRTIYSVAADFETGGGTCLGLITRDDADIWRDSGAPLACARSVAPDVPEISIIDPAYFEDAAGRAESPFGPSFDQAGRAMLDGQGTLFLEGDGAMLGAGHASVRKTASGDVQ